MPAVESAAANAAAQEIPKMLPKFFHKYVGNPVMFKFLKPFESKIPGLNFVNDAYTIAPVSKSALSIVPLYGVFIGTPPPEKIDMNTSASISFTGFVWSFYALIITPQNMGSKLLATVNFAMGTVNGYNVYRKQKYLNEQAAKAKSS